MLTVVSGPDLGSVGSLRPDWAGISKWTVIQLYRTGPSPDPGGGGDHTGVLKNAQGSMRLNVRLLLGVLINLCGGGLGQG